MIEFCSLCTGYGKAEVLHNASLKCENGKITTIIGPNGCGKSTLLKAAVGILPVKKGNIEIDGVSVNNMPHSVRAQKTAYLSQGKNIPDITVERMVLHGRFPHLSYPRRYRKCDYAAAKSAMLKMGIEELAEKHLSELSGGMRQKVYIAMALCQGADILILDEPSTYLDVAQQIKINEICKELACEGRAVIMVSHDIISALKISDKIAVMCNGEVVSEGAPEEIVGSGIIPEVFGVELVSVVSGESTEYYYKKRAELI